MPLPTPHARTDARTLMYIVNNNCATNDNILKFTPSRAFGGASVRTINIEAGEPAPDDADCVILDSTDLGAETLRILERLRASRRHPPVIVLANASDLRGAVKAMRAGAFDVLEKPVDEATLRSSVDDALCANRAAPPTTLSRADANARLARLTPRQHEILAFILAGYLNKNIAADLGISRRTVENHRAAIMKKAGARSISALVQIGIAAA